jgi:hypothetical protein
MHQSVIDNLETLPSYIAGAPCITEFNAIADLLQLSTDV